MNTPELHSAPKSSDWIPLPSGGKRIRIDGATFSMTLDEWDQVKTWIAARQQETAMRWWATAFDMPFPKAVEVVNKVQIAIEFKALD